MRWSAVLANRRVRRGFIAVALLSLVALAAPILAPHPPNRQLGLSLQTGSPSATHPLGTDFFSRDVLSRVMYGARISLTIAFFAVLVSITVGTAVGLFAGLGGPIMDELLMRAVDVCLAIPRIFLLLVVLALWGNVGVPALILLLGLTSWFGTSRLVRAGVLSVRNREYIAAARALGIRTGGLVLRHVLPNVAAPILVTATLSVGQIVLIEAGLSYLGIGVAPPTPSLGAMISEGHDFLATAPWISTAPGVVVVLTVLAFSVLGEGLREVLDPGAAAA